MLELKNITKVYEAGGVKVDALKGVSIAFGRSGMVSILGHSGCGKTTLLNIIGGLDHYTSGDLVIDGISTTNYTDRDWDTYRNHRIGFVFQSYNLIPHQTIQANVELALNISGVEKSERVRRAREALDMVGLSGLYNKKPNQLSGGQMQRVAIARALVNDPEILLADEPTGALDSETSVQIMDLIQEISNHCLVIMVTHNPELAEKYSTRIIRLMDGEVQSDSNPYVPSEQPEKTETETETESADSTLSQTDEEAEAATEQKTKQKTSKKQHGKKSKLSFWSAFKLSASNLLSKLKRTILVCFAGSIGIIGVATVLAVSSGVQDYIHTMQDDMLSGNPVTISTEAFDMSTLMSGMTTMEKAEAVKSNIDKKQGINVKGLIAELAKRGNTATSAIIQNNITKEYLEYVQAMPKEYYRAINATYGINLSNNLYTDFDLEGYGKTKLSLSAALAMYTDLLGQTDFKQYSSYIPMFTDRFSQLPDSTDFVLSQYDIVSDVKTSKFPTEANEILLVVNSDYSLADLTLAQYGYLSQQQFLNVAYAAVKDLPDNAAAAEKYDKDLVVPSLTYKDLMSKTFTWYPNDTIFRNVFALDIPTDNGVTTQWTGQYLGTASDDFENGIDLKVTAVLRRKDSVSYGCLDSGFYFTPKLTQTVIENGMQSKIVKAINDKKQSSVQSYEVGGVRYGIKFNYKYKLDGEDYSGEGLVGSENAMTQMLGMMQSAIPGGGSSESALKAYALTLYELGGVDTPNRIEVYPTDFNFKDNVTSYLDGWNKIEGHEEIKYTDNLALIINMVNDFIDIITYALVAFTALSLVVSTVMIAIITYVSVMERIKEIGVIRSLGGRKRDVSALFIAETFIIGGTSGVFGIAITYVIQVILNLIVGNLVGIYTIAALPVTSALIMIALSIVLTLISGLIPARLAAKKDPVVALRTE